MGQKFGQFKEEGNEKLLASEMYFWRRANRTYNGKDKIKVIWGRVEEQHNSIKLKKQLVR